MLTATPPDAPWAEDSFVAALKAVGAGQYHDRHPFNVRMNGGALSPAQVGGWIANRFHYQTTIPRKDAAILSRCPDRDVRRGWIRRIVDHDGTAGGDPGGIEAWIQLGLAAGLSRAELNDERHVVPGVRFACAAYLELVQTNPWPIAIASSLTELFAPDLMATRIAAFERHYPFVQPEGLKYFRERLTRAPRDAKEALAITLTHCRSRDLQEAALAALRRKCEILWTLLDAVDQAYPAEGRA